MEPKQTVRPDDSRIRVLVVDDSALMRNIVSRMVEQAIDCSVVGTAMNGRFALQKLDRLNPDVIVLDLEMPTMNGIEFLRERRERGIDIPVVILSSVAERGAQITMEALALGASDFVTKPSGAVSHDIHLVANQLIALVRGFGGRHRERARLPVASAPESPSVVDEPTTREEPAAAKRAASTPTRPKVVAPRIPATTPGPVELIAIGISTGGPNALRKVLAELDPSIPAPIVIVQHMPAGFTTEFAASLNRVARLEVKEAADGDVLRAGRVLIAPGNVHMSVERRSLAGTVHLSDDALVNGHRPSVGVLFHSVARHFGRNAMAVIMTGMGRDGALEIGEIYEAGGMTLAQDEASSVVYGMPRVAMELGYIHRQVPLSEMAGTIADIAASLATVDSR